MQIIHELCVSVPVFRFRSFPLSAFSSCPTGYGKSLCYQALPFVMYHKNGLAETQKSSAVLVITPLIALMFDQVQSLRSKWRKV